MLDISVFSLKMFCLITVGLANGFVPLEINHKIQNLIYSEMDEKESFFREENQMRQI